MGDYVKAILEYIKTNSIDFIAIIASIFIALETDRYINWRKERKNKRTISDAIFNELTSLKISLSNQSAQSQSEIAQGMLLLKLAPYHYPYWISIRNTDRMELFADTTGYSETIAFYSELELLNQWENMQTQYILFSNDHSEQYISDLVRLISLQRTKCLNALDKALNKIKEDRKR